VKDERLLTALIDKRAHIAGEILGLEKQLSTLRAAIIHIDATLKLLDPDIRITEIRSKRPMFARSGYFAQGELSTRCQDAMRVAGPDGVSAEEVSIQALKEKELDPSDEKLRSDFVKRLVNTFERLSRAGAARRLGRGQGGRVRWALREER
jgi:hypothetical protein